MAAAGVAIRTLQEWMGHRDYKTTLIYADYAPAANEAALVNAAFATDLSINLSINLRETGSTQTKKTLEIAIDRPARKFLENDFVVQAVVGSNPIAHPNESPANGQFQTRLEVLWRALG
jgi:hypothetical protein